MNLYSSATRQYIYPMANATNGGESHSEYNIRQSLTNLLSYSAAFSDEDFNVKYSNYVYTSENDDGIVRPEGTLQLAIGPGRGNCNGYFVDCSAFGEYTETNVGVINNSIEVEFNLNKFSAIIDKIKDDNADLNEINSTITLGLYVCIDYAQNIANGISYKLLVNRVRDNVRDIDFDLTRITDSNEENCMTLKSEIYDYIYNRMYKPLGFNDIGILVGNLDIEINYNRDNNSTTYEVKRMINNPEKTRCIDLNRLGSSRGLVSDLSDIIVRLERLNIFGGSFYVSNTLNLNANNELVDLGSDGVRSKYDGDYRLKMHLNVESDNESEDNQYNIIGGLSLVDVGLDETNDKEVANILSFNCKKPELTELETDDGVIEKVYVCNDITIQVDKKLIVNDIDIINASIDNLTVEENAVFKSICIENNVISFGDGTVTIAEIQNSTQGIKFNRDIYAQKVYGAVWQ